MLNPMAIRRRPSALRPLLVLSLSLSIIISSLAVEGISDSVNMTSPAAVTTNAEPANVTTTPTPIASRVTQASSASISSSTEAPQPTTTTPSITTSTTTQPPPPRTTTTTPTTQSPPTTTATIMLLSAESAPDSGETSAADATSQFGLNFLKQMSNNTKDNLVISPLSLQNLFSMILLGAADNSTTQQELIKVLGYEQLQCAGKSLSEADRLRPHESLRRILDSIMASTHLPVQPTNLLNTNTDTIDQDRQTPLIAHLQTGNKDDEMPLAEQVNFTLANLVITNQNLVKLNPSYEQELKSFYSVKLENFKSATSPPLHDRVNEWVSNKTNGMINKLATKQDLDSPDLLMVLLNAAYFKGRWLHTFNTKATHEQNFYNQGDQNSPVEVPFMRKKDSFGYADFGVASITAEASRSKWDTDYVTDASGTSQKSEESLPTLELSKEEVRRFELATKLDCSVLSLPFSLNDGREMSMVLLLPAKRDGIDKLQKALDAPTLNEIYKSLVDMDVQVELPKFTLESSHDAKETLVKMGLESVFEQTARLDRMFGGNSTAAKRGGQVDKVIHKAKILVDESGAEAAAASMATVMLRSSLHERPPPRFIADHPFMFLIRHHRSNMPLFMGRLSTLGSS